MAAVPYSAGVRRAALPVTTFVQAASSAAVIGPTVAAPLLLQRLELTAAAVGLFVALVYLGAMVATQVGAHVVRRVGPIRASQIALLVSACGLLLISTPSVPLAALGAWVVGLGYGPITPASSQMLSRTTDARHYALVFSIKQTGVPLGGVIAGLMVPPLVLAGGAVGALWGVAALCALAAFSATPLAGELDRERDAGSPWPRPAQMLAPVRFVATHPVLRSVAMVSFVFSMVQVSLTSYMVSLLTGELRWPLAAAGAALAVSQVAGVVGRIAWGFVADRWLGPRRMLLGLALGMTVCALLTPLLDASSPVPLVLFLLVMFGATAVGWNGVYLATVARLVPQAEAGMATAGTLFFTFFGVVIGPPLFGAAGTALGALAPAFACLALPLTWGLWVLARSRWG
jgi:predicted MFS family arabinose efflux permease